METIQVKFETVDDVSKFVQVLSKYDCDFDLYCGSYCVDAKSILGIMTMDLRNKMWMTGVINQDEKRRLIHELGPVAAVA